MQVQIRPHIQQFQTHWHTVKWTCLNVTSRMVMTVSVGILRISTVHSLGRRGHYENVLKFRLSRLCFSRIRNLYTSRAMRRRVLRHMQTAKAQISMRIHAAWSGPSLSANRVIRHCRMLQQRTNALMWLEVRADWYKSLHFWLAGRHFFRLTRSIWSTLGKTEHLPTIIVSAKLFPHLLAYTYTAPNPNSQIVTILSYLQG